MSTAELAPVDLNLSLLSSSADNFAKALKTLAKPKGQDDVATLKAIELALQALAKLTADHVRPGLEAQLAVTKKRIEDNLAGRREALHQAAATAGVRSKREGVHDRVGVFKVTYPGKKVRIELGSEVVEELEEADGQRLFQRLQALREELDRRLTKREDFIRTLRAAYGLARVMGRDRDGFIPIRTLYANVVLARHGADDSFLKQPEAKAFSRYPTYQFIYDLARFGQQGWEEDGCKLHAQGPNMAANMAKASFMLPNLDSLDGMAEQIAMLRVEKKQG